MIDIEAINIKAGVVLLTSGETVSIDTFLDDCGEECARHGNVKAIVVHMPDGSWAAAPVDSFETVMVH